MRSDEGSSQEQIRMELRGSGVWDLPHSRTHMMMTSEEKGQGRVPRLSTM